MTRSICSTEARMSPLVGLNMPCYQRLPHGSKTVAVGQTIPPLTGLGAAAR
jgi:hypothetical protein